MIDRIFQEFARKAGLPPGSVVLIGEKKEQPSTIQFVRYSDSECIEREYLRVNDLPDDAGPGTVTWIHMNGIHHPQAIEELGIKFDFHYLVLEDIVNTGHRAKFDDWDDYLFLIVKSLIYNEQTTLVMPGHISIICSADIVYARHGRDLMGV